MFKGERCCQRHFCYSIYSHQNVKQKWQISEHLVIVNRSYLLIKLDGKGHLQAVLCKLTLTCPVHAKPTHFLKGIDKNQESLVNTICHPGWRLPNKRTECSFVSFMGEKRGFGQRLRVFSPSRSTAEAFVAPFRMLSQKYMTGDNLLFKNWHLLGGRNVKLHS